MPRINLLVNPSFRLGMTAWSTVAEATAEIASGFAFYGADSLRVTKSANAGSGITTTDFVPVLPSTAYALSAYAYVEDGDPDADLAVRVSWYNSANTIVGENTSTTNVVSDGEGWVRVTGVYSAPGSASKAKISIIQISSAGAGNTWLVDAVLFEQSNYVGGFLDNLTQTQENAIVNKALSPVANSAIFGMQLNADVILNDLVLNTIDEDNVLWVCTDIEGWWGNAVPEIPDIPRGVEDGSYDVTGRYQARQLNLTGVMIPPSSSALGPARDRLIQAINLVRKGAWLRTNEGPTRAAFVRLSGRPQIETVNARGKTVFSIGLRAADPIKYQWNDTDPDGYTIVDISGTSGAGLVTNVGTADVSAIFTLTGPLGLNSTITNETNGETITLVQPLRGANAVATVATSELFENEATLTTTAPHGLRVGDIIVVSGVGAPYDSVNETFVATSVSDELPYSVSYYRQAVDRAAATVSGSVGLANNDILEIDTYERSVKYNGELIGNRSKLETLVDWVKIVPGVNVISYDDSIDESKITKKQMSSGVAKLTTQEAHFLDSGDEITVMLPVTRALKRKALTSNVATITTSVDHGFSVGDKVDVESTALSEITNKALTTNVATLTTLEDGQFNIGDSIAVALPVTVSINTKAVTSNVVTLTTEDAHGFSVADSVTVTLPTAATVKSKTLVSNAATLTTTAPHGFSIGDAVLITMPTVASVINKSISGSSITLRTSAAHGFSRNDSITISLPTANTLTGARSMAGGVTRLATVNTTTDHGFVVGDKVLVDVNAVSVRTVTNRASSTTTRTLTTSAAHGFRPGERITVSGINANYDGDWVILAAPTTTTLTYTSVSFTEASTASGGSILNNTIATGYNGTKVIETVPTATSFTFLSYADETPSSGATVTGAPAVTNVSNTWVNGTYPIASVPSSTTLQYTKV